MNNDQCPFSVLELHEKSVVEDLPRKNRQKFDHLILGPAAGQGLPNRLQCQGRFIVLVNNMLVFPAIIDLLFLFWISKKKSFLIHYYLLIIYFKFENHGFNIFEVDWLISSMVFFSQLKLALQLCSLFSPINTYVNPEIMNWNVLCMFRVYLLRSFHIFGCEGLLNLTL